jgi:hypothetical protein
MSETPARLIVNVEEQECRRVGVSLEEVKSNVRAIMDAAKNASDGGEGTCGNSWDADIFFEDGDDADETYDALEQYMETTFGSKANSGVAWVDCELEEEWD